VKGRVVALPDHSEARIQVVTVGLRGVHVGRDILIGRALAAGCHVFETKRLK